MLYCLVIIVLLSTMSSTSGDDLMDFYKDSVYAVQNLTFEGRYNQNTSVFAFAFRYMQPLFHLRQILRYNVMVCNVIDEFACAMDETVNFDLKNASYLNNMDTYAFAISEAPLGLYSFLICVIYNNKWRACAHRMPQFTIEGSRNQPELRIIQNNIRYLPKLGNFSINQTHNGRLSIYFEWKFDSSLNITSRVRLWAVIIHYFTSTKPPIFLTKSERNYTFADLPNDEEIEIKLCLITTQIHAILEQLCEYLHLNPKSHTF